MKSAFQKKNWSWITIVMILTATGCSSDPKLSPQGYQQAMALLNACGRKNTEAIERLANAVGTAQENAEISEKEASALMDIIDSARNGSWEAASARVRKLMENQVTTATGGPQGGARQRHRH